MYKQIKLLYKFWISFGLIKGTILFSKFKIGDIKSIKLPNIKYSISLRKQTSDIQVFHQIFLNREYDIKFNSTDVIIDAGANIGLFTIAMKNRYPESTIICLEPDVENYSVLTQNVSHYEGIFCQNCGLWSTDTKLKVFDKYGHGKMGIVVEEDNVYGNVQGISLESILKKYSIQTIDVLKVDIETSEIQLFSNGYQQWLPKVKTIVIELHDWMGVECAKPFFEAINKTFTKYEYSISGENTIIYNKDLEQCDC